MKKLTVILIGKTQLTHDVFELTYSLPENPSIEPGQYMMFQLEPGLNRAYSIAAFSETECTLIVKRMEEGKGSPRICDANIGDTFQVMIPLGHFVLKNTPVSKCFIGTGTGFAPLFAQIKATAQGKITSSVGFIFWVRSKEDLFYEETIQQFASEFSNFEYVHFLSRDEVEWYQKWYVTDWITAQNTAKYNEFYICGSPVMVKDARAKLEWLGIPKEAIFFEQF